MDAMSAQHIYTNPTENFTNSHPIVCIRVILRLWTRQR